MIRHLIPRFDWGGWSGGALTRSPRDGQEEDVNGGCLCIQWLGFLIEIGFGRVS